MIADNFIHVFLANFTGTETHTIAPILRICQSLAINNPHVCVHYLLTPIKQQ